MSSKASDKAEAKSEEVELLLNDLETSQQRAAIAEKEAQELKEQLRVLQDATTGFVKFFLYYLALNATANCICELHCIALDGFDLNSVHKFSSKEKKSWKSQDSNPGLLDGKHECYLCATKEQNWGSLLTLC